MTFALFTAQIGHYHDARYRAFATMGVNFVVVATQNEADFSELMALDASSYPVREVFENRAAYLQACKNGKVWSSIRKSLSELDPSVVIVAGWATPESFAAIAWARQNRRHVVIMSESQGSDAVRSVWREWVKARVVGLCDAALVGGPSHRDYILQLGMPTDYIFMGYDAVDNMHFAAGAAIARKNDAAVRARLGLPNRYILASARFIKKKNLPRLVLAYEKVMLNRCDAPDLVILGDGPDRPIIEANIASTGLTDKIHLLGFRGYNDLPALYGLCEGFVHVSTSEQWGLVINEAAASGVPVIASSACGSTGSLVIDGQTGFVVEADCIRSICNGIRRLIDLSHEKRVAMGCAGQSRVSEWGVERFSSGLLSACRAAQARRARGLSHHDAALLHFLARKSISAVQ